MNIDTKAAREVLAKMTPVGEPRDGCPCDECIAEAEYEWYSKNREVVRMMRNNAAAWLDALDAQAAEIAKLKKILDNENHDWADTDNYCRESARRILGNWVDGDSYGVPAIEDIVDRLVETAQTRFVEAGRHPPMGFPGEDDPRQTKEDGK